MPYKSSYRGLSQRLSKPLIGLILLAIFFAPLQGFAPVAQADVAVSDPSVSAGDAGNATAAGTASAAQAPGAGVAAAAQQNATNQALTQAAQQQTTGSSISSSCSWTSNWDICLSNVVYVFTVGLMSIFAYIGSYIFDIGVQLTLQSVTYSQLFLTQTWAAVRDLANMAFIFLLVYLAIIIVLRAETAGTTKMLAGIIIAALLINFSFFITRLVIDAGNILAIQFYNAISAPALAQTSGSASLTSITSYGSAAINAVSPNNSVKDLTANIMNLIGVQTLLSPGSFASQFQQSNGFLTTLITFSFIYIAVGAILAMLAFTFIAVGFKFIVRIVVLWLVIIASPLAFVAKAVFNKGSSDRFGLFKRWQNALIQFTFYPAVFLFIFWIINTIVTQMSGCDAGAANAQNCSVLNTAFQNIAGNVTSGNTGSFLVPLATAVSSVTIYLSFIVILLFLAMKASDKIANTGVKVVDTLGGRAGGWISAGGALLGRNTAGWAGYGFARSNVGRRAAAEGGYLGRTLWRGADRLGRATYDVRNSRIGRTVAPVLPGGGIGSGTDRNYQGQFDQRVRRRTDEANRLRPNTRQIDAAYNQAINTIAPENSAARNRLEGFYENYIRDQELFDSGQIDETRLRKSKSAFENELRSVTGAVSAEAGRISGTNNPTIYADSLETRSLRNLGGIVRRGFPLSAFSTPQSDREAASLIRGRGGLDANARLREILGQTPNIPGGTQTYIPPRVIPPIPPVQPPAPATPTPGAPGYVTSPGIIMPAPGAIASGSTSRTSGGGAGPRPATGGGGGARPRSNFPEDLNNVMGAQQQRALRELREPSVLGDTIGRRQDIVGGGPSNTQAPAVAPAPGVTPEQMKQLGKDITGAIKESSGASNTLAKEQLTVTENMAKDLRRQGKITQGGFSSLRETLASPQVPPTVKIEGNLSQDQREVMHTPPQPSSAPPRAIPRVVPPAKPIPPAPEQKPSEEEPPHTA